MLTRPTTEQVLIGVANDLRDSVAPEVHSEPIKVMLSQIDQILRGCAERSAHEIAWIHDEADTISAVTGTEVVGRPRCTSTMSSPGITRCPRRCRRP